MKKKIIIKESQYKILKSNLKENFFRNPEMVKMEKEYFRLNKKLVAIEDAYENFDTLTGSSDEYFDLEKQYQMIQARMSELSQKMEELENGLNENTDDWNLEKLPFKYGNYIKNHADDKLYLVDGDESDPQWEEIISVSSQGDYFVNPQGYMYRCDRPDEAVAKLDFKPSMGFQLERINDTDFYFYENQKIVKGGIDDIVQEDEDFFGLNKGRSNSSLKRSYINKITSLSNKLTKRVFKDDNWEAVRALRTELNKLPFVEDLFLGSIDGGYRTYSNNTQTKEYSLKFICDNNIEITGVLKCHAAGTEKDPFSMYDITVTLF